MLCAENAVETPWWRERGKRADRKTNRMHLGPAKENGGAFSEQTRKSSFSEWKV